MNKTMMKYKGYYGEVTYDNKAKIFHGELVGIRAVVTFQGSSVEELETAFKESIDDYLEWCKKKSIGYDSDQPSQHTCPD